MIPVPDLEKPPHPPRLGAPFDNKLAVTLLIQLETGAIRDANPAACAYPGWLQATLTAMKITNINTLSEAEVKAEMHNALSGQRNYFQNRHRLANKDRRDAEAFRGPIKLAGAPCSTPFC